eukprot:31209-Pelagococcus_subviridis.AAC.2
MIPYVTSTTKPQRIHYYLRTNYAYVVSLKESPHEVVHVARAQADALVVLPRHVELIEHVLGLDHVPAFVAVIQRPLHVKHRDHLVAPFRNHERVRLPRRLEHVAPFLRDPVVLEVPPLAS